MKGYVVAKITQMIDAFGEDQVHKYLSEFRCVINQDVERFLQQNAVNSDKQGFSTTRLVFASYQDAPVLAGYFTLANKVLVICKSCRLNSQMKSRVRRFGNYNKELKQREIPAPLIAQLGKNDTYAQYHLISGDDLLEIATEHVRQALRILGGRVVYLECEDTPRLLEFYKRNGFVVFDDRQMDSQERTVMRGTRLMQLIKYFDSAELGKNDDNRNVLEGFTGGFM
ncbi:MAG: N-acetyltransferase [Eubacteriales bacterium]|nr:N-acetyltransferase [Eubacteriales bacterium]